MKYSGQPPFRPNTLLSDVELDKLQVKRKQFLDSQVFVKRPLVEHVALAFTQGFIESRNIYDQSAKIVALEGEIARLKTSLNNFPMITNDLNSMEPNDT